MTQRLLSNFEKDRSYYVLESSGDIDNPDQRIAEDVHARSPLSHWTQTRSFSHILSVRMLERPAFSSISQILT